MKFHLRVQGFRVANVVADKPSLIKVKAFDEKDAIS